MKLSCLGLRRLFSKKCCPENGSHATFSMSRKGLLKIKKGEVISTIQTTPNGTPTLLGVVLQFLFQKLSLSYLFKYAYVLFF